MPVKSENVRVLADAYRRMLNEGDSEFRGQWLQWLNHKILVAIVVKSATDQASWIGTRVPGGGELKKELEGVADDLRKHNVVGNSLEAMKGWLLSQVPLLIGAAIGIVVWPAWLLIGATWVGNLVVGAYGFGYGLGTLVLTVGLSPLLLVWLVKGTNAAGDAAAIAWAKILNWPSDVGSRPEELFKKHARPALEGLYRHHGSVGKERLRTPILPTLRCLSILALMTSVVLLLIVGGQFIAGAYKAWKEYDCRHTGNCRQ